FRRVLFRSHGAADPGVGRTDDAAFTRRSGAAPDPADSRRGAPVRDRRAPRAPRQGARDLVAQRDSGNRRETPPAAARALRRAARRRGGGYRRAGACGGREPVARGADLSAPARLMPLNVPNLITWLRILLIPLIVGVYYLPEEWLSYEAQNGVATGIFIFAAVTDWLDGYLARVLNQMSAFGAFLDPVADKLVVVAALIVLLKLGRVDMV